MSGIPEVPEAERTCDNCRWQGTNSRYVRCFECKGLGSRNWEEHLTSLRTRAEVIIAELQAAVNGLAHTCDHLEDDRDYNAGLVGTLTKELDEIGKQWHVMAGRIAHICQLLGVDFTCEEPETCEQVIERRSGELAAMRSRIQDAIKHYDQSSIREVVHCSSIGNMLTALITSDAGKPEADVIAAALDDFHPDALADIAYDLDMTTGAEGHEDAILAYLKTLPTAEAVERLQGKEKG